MKQHGKTKKNREEDIEKKDIKICHLKERKEITWLKVRTRNETRQMK